MKTMKKLLIPRKNLKVIYDKNIYWGQFCCFFNGTIYNPQSDETSCLPTKLVQVWTLSLYKTMKSGNSLISMHEVSS